MEWTNEIALALIALYEQKELLWNSNHQHHYNNVKKEQAWRQIASEINCPVRELKKKMDSLKGSFRRERSRAKRKIATAKGKEEIYKSSWFAYKAFEFLDKDKPWKILSTINDEEPDRLYNTEEWKELLSQAKEDQNYPVTGAAPRRAKKAQKFEDEAIVAANSTVNTDECEGFAMFVRHKLGKYSEKTRNAVQFHISQLLYNADQGQYEERSQPYQPLTSCAFGHFCPLQSFYHTVPQTTTTASAIAAATTSISISMSPMQPSSPD